MIKNPCPECGEDMNSVNWRVDKERDPHYRYCPNCHRVEDTFCSVCGHHMTWENGYHNTHICPSCSKGVK